MDESQTMSSIWLYADAQPSLDAAATTAIELAAKQGAALNIIGVLETKHEPLLQTPAGRDLVRILCQDKQDRLHTMYEQASRELGAARVKSRLLDGEVAWHTLTRHAVEEMPDLIIVPAEDGATAGRFGTLSQHLFRKCPSPVWSVLPAAGHLPKQARPSLLSRKRSERIWSSSAARHAGASKASSWAASRRPFSTNCAALR